MRLHRIFWRGWNPRFWFVFDVPPADRYSRLVRIGPIGFIVAPSAGEKGTPR